MDWKYYKIKNELAFFFGYDPESVYDDEDAFAAASEDTYEATMIKKEGDLLVAFGEENPDIDETVIKLIHGNAIMEVKQSYGQGFTGNPFTVDLKSLVPDIENGRIWFSKDDWKEDFEEYVPDFKTFTDLDSDIMQDLF